MRAVDAGRSSASARRRLPSRTPPSIGWKLGVGLSTFGAEGATYYLRPALGAALAAADVIVPLIMAVVLLTAILRGGSETCERVFRLLRWVTNRPELPAPGDTNP